MAVFVLNKQKNPLMPCSEKPARLLLERGRVIIVRRYPFTIRLRDRVGGETQLLRLKLDRGSRTTGLALVHEKKLVRFDTHLLHNPEVSGVAYQQGELASYEVRKYLLKKWGRCWTLFHTRQATSLPVETSTDGHTKFNRSRLNIPKTHALDAACVGTVATQ
jgi:hypothetical protein